MRAPGQCGALRVVNRQAFMRFINLRQFLYLQIVNLQADVRNNLLAAVSMLANLINGTSGGRVHY